MSNSKLNTYQKSARKDMLRELKEAGGFVFSFPDNGVTIVIRRTGAMMGEFACAIVSPDENKNRQKVGEYFALDRWMYYGTQPVFIGEKFEDDAAHLEMVAEGLANAIG